MPVANDIKNDVKKDIKAAKKMWLPWWAVVCLGIGSFLAAWLFDHFGRLNLVLPTLNSVGMLGFTVAVKWKLRQHTWFWGTIAILATLHVPLILFIPWTTKWVPASAIAAIDSGDLIVMLAILAVVRRFMEAPNTPEG